MKKDSRLDPRNREEAFAYQFEDDVRVLHACALAGETHFEKALQTIEIHISAYRNKNLRKRSDKQRAKYNPLKF